MSAAAFETRVELEDGFRLPVPGDGSTVRSWVGYRVRYRPAGARGVWRSFLLDCDGRPTEELLQRACAAHDEAGRG